jgi:hypothetical protein
VIAARESARILATAFRALIFLALACTAQPAGAQDKPAEARIASVSGTPLLSSSVRARTAAKRGDVLSPGDEIDTRGGGYLTIELTDGSLVVVRPGSRVLLKDFRAANTLRELFEVLLGRVLVRINHFGGKPNPYRINSPTASIAVRGTEFTVVVDGVEDTEVIVYEGLVEVISLSSPQNQVLVHPGQGVIVRPYQEIYFFQSGTTGEIGSLGRHRDLTGSGPDARTPGDPRDSARADSPRNSAAIYDRFVEDVVDTRQGPMFLRFTAYPDSFLDGLENPAYVTEFSAPEGRVFLLPSFRGSQSVGVTQSMFLSSPGESVDYSLSPQVTFFTPLFDHRISVGGSVAAFRSDVQSFKLDDDSSLSDLFFPPGTTGTRASSHSTNTSFLSGTFAVAHAFGEENRTSVGLGFDWVRGGGSLLHSVMQQDAVGNVASERIDSDSNVTQNRFTAGASHDFSAKQKLGIYYSYGFVSANFGNDSHTLNGQPARLDAKPGAGRSSEVGIRFRGVLTRKLFYGAQASWFLLSLDDELKLPTVVNSHEHHGTRESSFAIGFGYALRPRIIFTLDLAGGFSNVTTARTEVATGNILQRERKSSPFLSAHEAIQADVWRHMFVSGSLLTVRQTLSADLALYPDRLGRLLTSGGTFAPNGVTRDHLTTYYSEFGSGWRFTKTVLAEYVFSTDYGVSEPSHVFLLRYDFRLDEH